MRRSLFALVSVAGLVLAGCGGGQATASPRTPLASAALPSAGQAGVYIALGASETIGIGAAHPNEEAWPQVFYRTALPRAFVFYDLGIPAETTAEAINNELPIALSLHPTLATVWFNFDDLVGGVSVVDYEQRLANLVHQLRAGGRTQVLIANTPVLDKLPVYAACGAAPPPGSPRCPLMGQVLPSPLELDGLADAYNAAVARVAAQEGATLVDLHAQGEVPVDHPDFVSADGFHPSTAGHAAIAGAFASAYRP